VDSAESPQGVSWGSRAVVTVLLNSSPEGLPGLANQSIVPVSFRVVSGAMNILSGHIYFIQSVLFCAYKVDASLFGL